MAGDRPVEPPQDTAAWPPTTASGYGCAVAAGTWLFEFLVVIVVTVAFGWGVGSATYLLLVTLPVTIGTSAVAGLGGVLLFRRWISPTRQPGDRA